jgi:hypothetical protein
MSEAVQSFKDIESAIHNTRVDYYRLSSKAREELSPYFDLLFSFWRITGKLTNDRDPERYVLEIGAVVFRRIVSSLALLESGLILEAIMIIRNAIENLAILIDISFNETSFAEWEKTSNKNVEEMNQENWYFKFSSVIKRVTKDQTGMYPDYEVSLAERLQEQWQSISNLTLHAHSHSQIQSITTGPGEIQLFGLLKEDEYLEFFKRYQATLFILITSLRRNPSISSKLKTRGAVSEIQTFMSSYNKLLDSLKNENI